MDVFVYGTLCDADRVADVLGECAWSFAGDATLEGLHRIDGRYPTLAPGGTTAGRILRTDAIGALDAYEGVDRGLYVRVPVPRRGADDATDREAGATASEAPESAREDDEGAVAVYVGDPGRLDPAEPIRWPGNDDRDLESRVREYVDANDVAIALD